jgi:hypothetical protein
LFLIARAHGRTSSYDMSDIGATSPDLWHMAHLSYRIGAMSFPNEGFAVWANTVAGNNAAAMIQTTGTWDRIIEIPSSLLVEHAPLRTLRLETRT